MLVSSEVIDELEQEPWRPPIRVEVMTQTAEDEYDREYEDPIPEPGSADEIRQLVAFRVLLLHSTDRTDRATRIELAEKHGCAWLFDRWIPGLLTDWKRVGPSIVRFLELVAASNIGPGRDPSRDQRVQRELTDSDRRLVGLTLLTDRPALLVCENANVDFAGIDEARRAAVPWLAPQSPQDGDGLRLLRCAARCATNAARSPEALSHRIAGPLKDPMLPRPTWVRVNFSEPGPGSAE